MRTPNRPPVPDDIPAPDPSTPRTPGSFIHERRRVEHISPPPTGPLPPTPTRNVPDTQGSQSLSQCGIRSRDFGSSMTGSPRPQMPPSAGAIRNPTISALQQSYPGYFTDLEVHSSIVAAAFRQSSLRINTMQNVDPHAQLAQLAQQQCQNVAQSNTDSFLGSTVNDTPGPSRPIDTSRGAENKQKGSQNSHNLVEEPRRAGHTEQVSTTKPNTATSQSTDLPHGGSETTGAASDHVVPSSEPVASLISYVSDTQSLPYAFVENPVRDDPDAGDTIDVYHDLRVEPLDDSNPVWDDSIIVGSQIAFVGFTRWSDEAGQGMYDVGIPYGTQCVVARIFNDHWALCIKLDNGLELYEGDHSRRLRKILRQQHFPKIVSLKRTPSIAVKTHPVVVIYAPLCAFTLATNFAAFEEHLDVTNIRTPGLTTWQGGTVQAASRAASSRFEEEARKARKLYIPVQVWMKYQAYLGVFEQGVTALDENMARAMVSGKENAPFEGGPTNQDLSQASDRNEENVSTGRQRQSFKSGTDTIRKTVRRVKSVLKPGSGSVVKVSSNRIDIPQGTPPHPTHGNPSGLAPERTNTIPPIAAQGALNPFDNDQALEPGSSRALTPRAGNIMSSTSLPLMESLDNSNVVAQRQDGTGILMVARETAISAGVIPRGAGAAQGEPHPGTAVVPVPFVVNTDPPQTDDEIQGIDVEGEDGLVLRNFALRERRDAGERNTATRPASFSLPFRGRLGQDASRGAVENLAALLRRRFTASADNAEPQEARLDRRSTMRRSLSRALESVQPSRRGRRQTILPRDPGESYPAGIFDVNPPRESRDLETGLPRDEPVANVAPSEQQHPHTATNVQATNPESPSDRSPPVPGGLMDHLRRIAPDHIVRRRLRSTPSDTGNDA